MIRCALYPVVLVLLWGSGCSGAPRLATADDKTIYSLGVKLGEGLVPLDLSPHELEVLKAGLSEAVAGRAPPVDTKAAAAVSALLARRTEARAAKEAARGPAFVRQAAREPGAVTLPSGVVYRELAAGTGSPVSDSSRVKVHLRGTLVDGTPIEDSYALGKPVVLAMGHQIVPCWTDAIMRLKVGGKAHVVCPPAAAFGDFGRPPIVAPGTTVAYDIELVDVSP